MEWLSALIICTVVIIASTCLVGWFEGKQRIKDAQEDAKRMENATSDK